LAGSFQLTEKLIQGYIDNRLNDRERETVASHLRLDAELAAKVEEMLNLNDTLKAVGAEILNEPIPQQIKKLLADVRSGAATSGNCRSI